MNKLKLASVVIFAATALTTRAGQAEIDFSGVLTVVSGPSVYGSDSVSVGSPFTGLMAWDTRWDGSFINLDPGSYPDDFIYPYLSLQMGDFSFGVQTAPQGVFGAVYIDNTAAYDTFNMGGEWMFGESIFGGATLIDSTGKAITTGAPSSNSADWNGGYIVITSPVEDLSEFAIKGTILFPRSIPDSTNTVTQLALGIAGLFLCPLVHLKRRRSE